MCLVSSRFYKLIISTQGLWCYFEFHIEKDEIKQQILACKRRKFENVAIKNVKAEYGSVLCQLIKKFALNIKKIEFKNCSFKRSHFFKILHWIENVEQIEVWGKSKIVPNEQVIEIYPKFKYLIRLYDDVLEDKDKYYFNNSYVTQ